MKEYTPVISAFSDVSTISGYLDIIFFLHN